MDGVRALRPTGAGLDTGGCAGDATPGWGSVRDLSRLMKGE